MQIDQIAEERVRQEIIRLLDEPRPDEQPERCGEVRQPFFRPITIKSVAKRSKQFSAFARELSTSGIGLLHSMPVECGETIVTIPSQSGEKVSIRTEIVWCQPCGEGWYLSGGRFLEADAAR